MTETGHGSNVQALGTVATYDAATAGVRDHTRRTTEARKDYIGNAAAHAELAVVFAQLEVGGRATRACTRSSSRSATDGAAAARRPDRGRRRSRSASTASTTAGSGSTTCGCRASALLNRFADVTAGRHLLERRSRTPTGASSRCSARWSRAGSASAAPAINASKVALTIAIRVRRCGAGSSRPTSEDEEELLLDYGSTSAGCSRCSPARTRCTSRRRWSPASCTTCSPARRDDEHARRELESRAAGTKALGTWHATRHHPGVPRGVRRRGLPGGEPVRRAQGRHRRVHDVRGRQHGAAAAGRQGPAHRLRQRASRTSTSSGWSGSSPGWRSRRWSSGPACTSSLERVRDLLPGGDEWDQEAGLLDPQYQLAMLRFREEHMLAGVARRLKRGIDDGHEPGRGVLPGPGPRHRRRPRARRAAGAGGVRREGRDAARTATTRSRSACSATCTRSRPSRPTGPGSWSTAGSPAAASKAISREINELCRKVRPLARRPRRRVRRPGGDAAQQGPGRCSGA